MILLGNLIWSILVAFPFVLSAPSRKRRCEYDSKPEFVPDQALDLAQFLLEDVMVKTDFDELRHLKRSFLISMHILPEVSAKKKSSVVPTEYWALFSHPIVQEALEYCVPELSAQEAVNFARRYPKYFFKASPPVLEAILDYSAFTVIDVLLESEHCLEGYLLDIESAVKTLPTDSIGKAIQNAKYELNPRQQKLIESRVPELLLQAKDDPRLVYQFALLYFDEFDYAALLEELNFDSKMQCLAIHPSFGNLIKASKIIGMKQMLPFSEWKMLVFAYVVYTDTLMEQIFAVIVKYYPIFVGLKESTFIKCHQLMINDLKLICQERSKLLSSCSWDKNWKILLSVPLSKQVRDALEAVDLQTKDILINSKVTHCKIQQWLWAQASQLKAFPFKVKSTKEIMAAFKNCFFASEEFKRFRGGHIASIFFNHIMFGEELVSLREELEEFFKNHANCYITNFGGIKERILVLKDFNLPIKRIMEASLHVFNSYYSSEENDPVKAAYNNFTGRLALEQLIQFNVPSNVLLEAIIDSSLPLVIDGVFLGEKTEIRYFYKFLQGFPEIIGKHHWEYFIEKKFFEEGFVANFTGNMIRSFDGKVPLPNFEVMARGLYAVPVAEIKRFLRQAGFMLDRPLCFAECMHPSIFKSYEEEASEESLEFFNMLTPWLLSADSLILSHCKLAETLIVHIKNNGNLVTFLECVIKYLLRNETNFLMIRVDIDYVPSVISNLKLERHTRQIFSKFLSKLMKKISKPRLLEIAKIVQTCLNSGPIGTNRIVFLNNLIRDIQLSILQFGMNNFLNSVSNAMDSLLTVRSILGEEQQGVDKYTLALANARKLKEASEVLMPGNDFNNLHFAFVDLESNSKTLRLGKLDNSIFQKALNGQFKQCFKVICKEVSEIAKVDFNKGEFVVNAAKEENKEETAALERK